MPQEVPAMCKGSPSDCHAALSGSSDTDIPHTAPHPHPQTPLALANKNQGITLHHAYAASGIWGTVVWMCVTVHFQTRPLLKASHRLFTRCRLLHA